MLKLVRYGILGVLLFLLSLLCILVFLFRPFHPDNGYFFTRGLGFFCFRVMGIRVIYKNMDRLLSSRPCIFVGNHQDNLDLFFFGHIIPKGTLSVGKHTLIYFPFFGLAYWLAGHFLIKRKDHLSALGTMGRVLQVLRERKNSLVMMPEGTRSHGRGMGPFKKGAFRLAMDLNWKIQPIVVGRSQGKIDLNKWRAGTVTIEALPPLSMEGKDPKNMNQIIKETRAAMEEALHRLDETIPHS